MKAGNTSARLIVPIAGVLAAIAVTTTMDATGLFMFSALPYALCCCCFGTFNASRDRVSDLCRANGAITAWQYCIL